MAKQIESIWSEYIAYLGFIYVDPMGHDVQFVKDSPL